MAEFTAKDVKALRDATGAGMMDAKKALTEAEGDRDRAAQILREKGLSKVATLEDRENSQGAIAVAREGNTVALVELKSETDFSAKADDFVGLVQKLADAVLADGEEAVAKLQSEIEDVKIAKKENIEVGTVARFEAAPGNGLDAYTHNQDGRGTNGVIIEIEGADDEAAHEIALHCAFAKPDALSRMALRYAHDALTSLLVLGERQNARRALDAGLFSETVDKESFGMRVAALASAAARTAPEAARMTKVLLTELAEGRADMACWQDRYTALLDSPERLKQVQTLKERLTNAMNKNLA